MKITADTNVLLRAYLDDDLKQSLVAVEGLDDADLVVISVKSLCEFAWVLARTYRTAREDIAAAIRALMETDNVVINSPAVEAGLQVLEAGGDFADGVVAYEGNWLGGEIFVSFDRKAVRPMVAQGQALQLLT